MRQPEGVSPRGAASRASRARLGFAWLAACKTLASKPAPAFPPAWLVGSTTATRTAFRVLWRPIRAAISVNFGRLPLPSGLIEREFRDASIKPLSGGSRPILTKIVVFPLGCPDTLVWGARAAKIPRDRRRCPTRWLGRPEPNLAFIGGVFGPTRVHVENAGHT